MAQEQLSLSRLLATALSFSLGAILGFTAAVNRRIRIDQILIPIRRSDHVNPNPYLRPCRTLRSAKQTSQSLIITVMGLLDSTRVYRLARAVAVDINVMDFVEAATIARRKNKMDHI